jgi:hypothetical protein
MVRACAGVVSGAVFAPAVRISVASRPSRRRGASMTLLLRACPGGLLFLGTLLIATTAWADEGAVTPGSDANARAYYSRIAAPMGLDLRVGATTLDDLLSFVGYPVSASKVEALDSATLMDPARASTCSEGLCLPAAGFGGAKFRLGDILATRFFAPKIVNVNVQNPRPGWRKLVRFRSRPDSKAARAGVQSVIILFNSFADASQTPFPSRSVNTQAMLLTPTRDKGLLWLDFDASGKLTTALNASFDAADLPSQSGGTRDYFVPDGCDACHGSPGNFRPPMVNYLDTDHWFDRLDTDFQNLKDAGTPLLFDAQTNDPSASSFAQAFDVIRQLNEEALLQNSTAHADSFEAEAARTWLGLHSTTTAHLPPVSRGFAADGGAAWQPSEADGLALLNRFCFRCHGSVSFSVFDRPAVVARAAAMRQRLKPSQAQQRIPGFRMPPDRSLDQVMTPSQLAALDAFLRELR